MNNLSQAESHSTQFRGIMSIPLKYCVMCNITSLPENTAPETFFEYIDISSVNDIGEISALEQYRFKEAPSRARRIVRKGDVIISTVRTYLKAIALLDETHEHAICSTGFAVLSPKNVVNSRYLYYAVFSNSFTDQVVAFSSGISYPAITSEKLVNLQISLPSMQMQRKIITYLDRCCAEIAHLIALQEDMIAELQAYKRSVITEAVTKGLDPDVPMKDSGVEWVNSCPYNWETIKLKYLCSMKSGTNLTSQDISDSGLYPVYGGNDVRGFFYNYNNECECLLIGRQGALCGNVKYVNQRIWATEHAVVTIPTKYTSTKYSYYLITAMNLNQHSISSAQPGLSVNFLQNLTTVLPEKEEQATITAYLDKKSSDIDALVRTKYSKIESLKEYKNSLIYECVTGKRDCTLGRQEDGT